jgi:hypothetical protein
MMRRRAGNALKSLTDETGSAFLWRRGAAALLVYTAVAAACTHPLLEDSGRFIAGRVPGDPILNASVLWWNAVILPFSPAWWNPPYFHLAQGVAAFTENLVGISVTASPILWLTGNPLTAYNVSLFLSWPLCAFAVYLLVLFLTRHTDAAFLAGLAFGFNPYRMAEYGHLQMMAFYWMPLALLGLHGYLARRRTWWLGLFAVAWVLQALANGYMLIMGHVLLGLWILYFCSKRDAWSAAWKIVLAWTGASLVLAPILFKYRAIHEAYNLKRVLVVPEAFSHPIKAFSEVPVESWLWSRVLHPGDDELFPGVTALLMVAVAAVAAVTWRAWKGDSRPAYRRIRAACLLVGTLALAGAIRTLLVGAWSVDVGGLIIRMASLHRAIAAMLVCGVALFIITPSLRTALARRSPLLFYAAGIVVFGLLCLGPVFRVGDGSVGPVAPYQWLLRYVPGFEQVRVPPRFWLIGIFCLSASAGLVLARVGRPGGRMRAGLFIAATCGVLLDGWLTGVPMSTAPQPWPVVEPSSRSVPILELPIGPGWDAPPTYRSIWHRRGVFNGVSGYDPPHYAPLRFGIDARDPAILHALATFGAFDVVIDNVWDKDGSLTRFVSDMPGVVQVASDGRRTAYQIPAEEAVVPTMGDAVPIASIRASIHSAHPAIDGRLDTEWFDYPQRPEQWVIADLGALREIGGMTYALADAARDYPRLLVVEVSRDGESWEQVWEGSMLPMAFRESVLAPRACVMRIALPVRVARFARLRPAVRADAIWRIAELQFRAPAMPAASADARLRRHIP